MVEEKKTKINVKVNKKKHEKISKDKEEQSEKTRCVLFQCDVDDDDICDGWEDCDDGIDEFFCAKVKFQLQVGHG